MIVLPECMFLSLSLKLPFQLVYLLPSLVADWHAHILTFLPIKLRLWHSVDMLIKQHKIGNTCIIFRNPDFVMYILVLHVSIQIG